MSSIPAKIGLAAALLLAPLTGVRAQVADSRRDAGLELLLFHPAPGTMFGSELQYIHRTNDGVRTPQACQE